MSTVDKEKRRRNFEAKRLYEERQYRNKIQTPKPIKEKTKRLNKKELLKHGHDEDYCLDL